METLIDPASLDTPGYQSLDRPLGFTPAAAAKVRELVSEEGNDALKLRVYIQGGGCSGFQYGFEFDETQGEDDLAIVTDDVTLLVVPQCIRPVQGAVDEGERRGGHTVNDEPQPQVVFAFGLRITNCAPCRLSA